MRRSGIIENDSRRPRRGAYNLRDNVSDRRFDIIEEIKPNVKEYAAIEKKLVAEHPVYSSRAEELIRFFIDYKKGIIKPDRFNNCEPVNKIFDENNIVLPVSMLAFPSGSLDLKKRNTVDIHIANKTHAIVWADNVYLSSTRILPEYLTEIKVSFSKKKNTDIGFIIQLMKDMAESFAADNGKVYYQETGRVIAELSR